MMGAGMFRPGRMHQWYVMAPTISDTGGPNELDITKNGRGGPLLQLDRVVVEPARSADELFHSDGTAHCSKR